MLLPYEELRFDYEGKVYYPMTDDVYEVDEGVYTSHVQDKQGKEYHAYYNDSHAKNDYWQRPDKVVRI